MGARALAHGDFEAGQGVLGGLDVDVDVGEPRAQGVRVGVMPRRTIKNNHSIIGGNRSGAVLAGLDVLHDVVAEALHNKVGSWC